MIKVVFTDLDGTLLRDNKSISKKNIDTLHEIKQHNILRIAATGRSIKITQKVLSPDFPVDYVIFSNGAGICKWDPLDVFYKKSLTNHQIKQISQILTEAKVSFMLHHAIPDNHHFTYYRSKIQSSDFEKRIEFYKDYCSPFNGIKPGDFGQACQFLSIIPNDVSLFENLKSKLSNFKVIRSTSPLDKTSIWIEIFDKSVSKGIAVNWLCDYLGLQQHETISIGNDYNDIDMLNYTNYSYIVQNAPHELKLKYLPTASNHDDGVAMAIQNHVPIVT